MAEDDNVGKEFQCLLNRSQELFDGLRDMPRFGIKHWQIYFLKTFEVFTKLWKFQQDNRATLEKTVSLQRHQIGDIASKIGQLYYHYYLHTSDPKYLLEAKEFYSAIHKRSYFKQHTRNIDLVVKYLRYLARYYVVALLLKDYDLLGEITKRLEAQVNSLSSEDSSTKTDWSIVSKEAKLFSQVDYIVLVSDKDGGSVDINQRLEQEKCIKSSQRSMKLKNAIIIGACEKQVKFSELTVDMYRALQLIEYQPNFKIASKSHEREEISQCQNPSKHLLYKPSFSQIYAFLSAVFKDLAAESILLIYISGDSDNIEHVGDDKLMYSSGIVTTPSSDMGSMLKKLPKNMSNPCCFYPEDIIPFTRKPLFLIVDAVNSVAYQSIPNVFNQPLLCLMSPCKLPDTLQSKKHGSLFTLFLLDSLLAICKLCNITKLTEEVWIKAKKLVERIALQSVEILLQETNDQVDAFDKYMGDDFLRNIISNYLLCWMVLRLYKKSEGPSCLPSCTPTIPWNVLEHKVLYRQILDVFAQLGVRHLFYEVPELPPMRLT
ncbi:protein SCAI-like isoform X1 [Hydractinia symbiolongicarpus]|uniref:protein SCAI-like isoform X1 n=2 Tax=Hydractinia symbiolongicarpus TaxID=13093 RepID=UPI00254F506E|nr:protein SCAI-like isoform X1 [Hydractinia symbiolongicarpus]